MQMIIKFGEVVKVNINDNLKMNLMKIELEFCMHNAAASYSEFNY